MDLRSIVNPVTQIINNDIDATWMTSTGYTTNSDFSRTPSYSSKSLKIQVQPISASDLMHVKKLNIQGVLRSVYIFGDLQGIIRADSKGGDMMMFPEIPGQSDSSWKVIKVVETWPDWSHVIVCLLNPETI